MPYRRMIYRRYDDWPKTLRDVLAARGFEGLEHGGDLWGWRWLPPRWGSPEMPLRIVEVDLTCDVCRASSEGTLGSLEGAGWAVRTWSAPLSEDAEVTCPACALSAAGGGTAGQVPTIRGGYERT